MRETVIGAALSYTKLIPSRVLGVASNIRVSGSVRNKDTFNVKKSEYIFDAAPSEMDNHADTHVFGRNFRVYFTMSKWCTVLTFLPEYSKQLDVPIVTGATAVDVENVLMVVPIFLQVIFLEI